MPFYASSFAIFFHYLARPRAQVRERTASLEKRCALEGRPSRRVVEHSAPASCCCSFALCGQTARWQTALPAQRERAAAGGRRRVLHDPWSTLRRPPAAALSLFRAVRADGSHLAEEESWTWSLSGECTHEARRSMPTRT